MIDVNTCILTNSDCFKEARSMHPVGIVVHSTGANNPYLCRYVQPDDGKLGKNKYNNSWNRPGVGVSTHAMIGKLWDDSVAVYQLLPYNIAAWGVGRGSKGSYNYDPTGHIQFEMCEDDLTDEKYFNKVMDVAMWYCAQLCKEYGWNASVVLSHKETSIKGYGSAHGDPENWLSQFGKNMDWFREGVASRISFMEKEVEDPEVDEKEMKEKNQIIDLLIKIQEEQNTLKGLESDLQKRLEALE